MEVRILLADDHVLFRAGIRRILEEHPGFAVVAETSSGIEAVELAGQHLPDVAIVDISAMVYDRLAAGKPLLITRPANPEAEIDTGGYLQACEWLDAADGATMLARVDEVAHDADALERLGVWVERYFGDTSPGVTTARFHEAVDHAHVAQEQRISIEAALQRLPEEQQIAVALVLVEGYAYHEAAEVLGIPVGTLTSRVSRGRETLASLLDMPGSAA